MLPYHLLFLQETCVSQPIFTAFDLGSSRPRNPLDVSCGLAC